MSRSLPGGLDRLELMRTNKDTQGIRQIRRGAAQGGLICATLGDRQQKAPATFQRYPRFGPQKKGEICGGRRFCRGDLRTFVLTGRDKTSYSDCRRVANPQKKCPLECV